MQGERGDNDRRRRGIMSTPVALCRRAREAAACGNGHTTMQTAPCCLEACRAATALIATLMQAATPADLGARPGFLPGLILLQAATSEHNAHCIAASMNCFHSHSTCRQGGGHCSGRAMHAMHARLSAPARVVASTGLETSMTHEYAQYNRRSPYHLQGGEEPASTR